MRAKFREWWMVIRTIKCFHFLYLGKANGLSDRNGLKGLNFSSDFWLRLKVKKLN